MLDYEDIKASLSGIYSNLNATINKCVPFERYFPIERSHSGFSKKLKAVRNIKNRLFKKCKKTGYWDLKE